LWLWWFLNDGAQPCGSDLYSRQLLLTFLHANILDTLCVHCPGAEAYNMRRLFMSGDRLERSIEIKGIRKKKKKAK
jgi:hypothetical protein